MPPQHWRKLLVALPFGRGCGWARRPCGWIPGLVALAAFAWLLTLTPSDFTGRAYAAYGGVYIAASLVWLWAVEGHRPDTWDLTGAMFCLIGVGVILFDARAA